MPSNTQPIFTVKQSTNNVTVDDLLQGYYEEARIQFDKPPEFGITVPNQSGVQMYKLGAGKEIQIRRNGVLDFTGIIDTPVGVQGSGASKASVTGIHKGYTLLQRLECTNFDYTESGAAVTVRNGVTVNPWDFFIFRAPNGTLGIDGLPPAVDGVLFDDAMRCCIGTRFIMQMDFQDNTFLRPSQVYATSNTIQAYRDGVSGQTRAALQRVRNGNNFLVGTAIESIPLQNGDVNVSTMGTIASATILLIGKRDANNNNPTLELCRNASSGSRTYTAITLTFISNYLSSGLDAWTGTVTFSGSESVKNSLGFRANIAGTGGQTGTTYLDYLKVVGVTASDTGVTEGSIETYSNPYSISGGGQDWVETDLQGMNRMRAIEVLRQQTVSDPLVNTSPHWDAWVDGSLAFNFSERRGQVRTHVYSFAEENLRNIQHEYNGQELAYQTIGFGTGSGNSQTRIVSKQAYTSGGLYDADRDPFGVTRLYGDLPRVISYIDTNEKSIVSLLRKTQAYHKRHRDPIEKVSCGIRAESIPYFTTGDSVPITNLPTRTSGATRVMFLKRSFSGGGNEQLMVEMGESDTTQVDHISNSIRDSKTLTIKPVPSDATVGLAGNGVYFDKDHYGVYGFSLADGALYDKVYLKFSIQPWQATSKSAVGDASTIQFDTGVQATTFTMNANATHTDPSDTLPTTANNDMRTVDYLQISFALDESIALTKTPADNFFLDLDLKFSTTPSGAVTYTKSTVFATVFDSTVAGATRAFARIIVNTADLGIVSSFYFRGFNSQVQHRGNTAFTAKTFTEYVQVMGIRSFKFGIFQFDGDNGNGLGNPLYGTNIKFAVDPTVSGSTGLPTPTNFTNGAHPVAIGNSQTVPSDIDIDVTGYLLAEGNGIIKSGPHKVFFQGAAASNNAFGLTVVSVTPVFVLKGEK